MKISTANCRSFSFTVPVRVDRIQWVMACKIIIDTERCKGCGLCVEVCGKNCIVISTNSNKNGYFPAVSNDTECTGCANCAVICSEAIIEVYRDSDREAGEPKEKRAEYNREPLERRKDKVGLTREKA
jgi:2-oxoglutarate ferredoxin oxidoreductase subunit delta